MKVDTENSDEQWAKSLSIRIQHPLPLDHIDLETSEDSGEETFSLPLAVRGFTRSSPASLMALRNLSVDDPLILFTPCITPAGCNHSDSSELWRSDPFESLGRELAKYHPNICHVPYVPGPGFCETHMQLLEDSAAIITVVCEPKHDFKKESMKEQYSFAEDALEVSASSTQGPVPREYVLVHCGTNITRHPSLRNFANVIETKLFNQQTAIALAGRILGQDEPTIRHAHCSL